MAARVSVVVHGPLWKHRKCHPKDVHRTTRATRNCEKDATVKSGCRSERGVPLVTHAKESAMTSRVAGGKNNARLRLPKMYRNPSFEAVDTDPWRRLVEI